MNPDKDPGLGAEGDVTDVCRGASDVKPWEEEEEEEEREDGSRAGGVMAPHVIKTEEEEMEDEERYPRENGEGASEDGTEEGFEEEDDEEEEEERDGDEEEDALNEPQDLSLADYSQYDGAAPPPDANAAANANAAPTTGERPFHCSQCGASFTQKGNLLRHIKLHSGEKPFKCPMCSYACRRRDALSGHLRTHSVDKPFKCSHCSRSYKQRSSLEEHRERCHVYAQRGGAEREDRPPSRTPMATERALLLDRLANNVAKRKSSMPQKFTGDHGVCLDLSFNREPVDGAEVKDPPGPEAHQHPGGSIGAPPPPRRHYPIQLGRGDVGPSGLTNGLKMAVPVAAPGLPPPHADGPQPVMYSLGPLLGEPGQQTGAPQLALLEALRVVRGEGGGGAVYPCGHCRVLFLDYVMFTIHMGCHGFRDPLQCNVCGRRSRDRYEFSSHITRGEHHHDGK
ncbi:zinc finger protein Aiolos-like isoform X2 [Pseudoliparis swirei]|uniref:zinc finger protein Aiolos-like isoform X2 n=1 Tax=Pseudoliparis swirei TaxID=2059687 RepID=UPI0024BECE42|nr:zinc finger protein Aiolos-like isoform X2 [Pseudoliparis swirei]